MKPIMAVMGLTVSLVVSTTHVYAQSTFKEPQEEFMRAKVIQVIDEQEDADSYEGMSRSLQTVKLRIISGPEKGKEFTTENGIINDRADMRMQEGETIVAHKLIRPNGSVDYLTAEKYRLTNVIWLIVFFLVLTVALGGLMGLTSIAGLVVSIFILTLYVVPKIASGANPMIVSLIGACGIACTSLYLAHGFKHRTSVALLSTLVTLGISVILSVVFVHLAKLFGMGTEESMYLQTGLLQNVNLRGLLLGGIIIGSLGVLDDVTTAQTAAIDEIRKANPSLSDRQLWHAGLSVGREHIASLINTLALAYVGSSLPLLLLFKVNKGYPLWVTLNSEFLSEEIIRTLVGSATLLFAVPISTWFAAKLLTGKDDGSPHGHSHFHGH